MKKRPNIVILNPDQMRADSMAHLGNPAAVTPHLDALAKDGMSLGTLLPESGMYTVPVQFYEWLVSPCVRHRTMNHMMHDHEPVLLKISEGYRLSCVDESEK